MKEEEEEKDVGRSTVCKYMGKRDVRKFTRILFLSYILYGRYSMGALSSSSNKK